MAITPRTIFSSAAPATVAAISLLAFTAVGTVAYMSSSTCPVSKPDQSVQAPPQQPQTCQNVRQALAADKSNWSERDWIHYATCFERHDRSGKAADVAGDGLSFYPRSEPLYNIKGYHQIEMDRHSEAINTLKTGLDRVGQPYSGVLENNLAWASLWKPREMSLDKARNLYRSALDRESNVCAYLHTGLWVEYAKARQAAGVERFEALQKFDGLRDRYEPCLSRVENGDWKTLAEVAGAATLFNDVDARQDSAADKTETSGDELLRKVAKLLDRRHSGVSVEQVCQDAMPLSTTHHQCVDQLNNAVAKVSHGEIQTTDADSAPAGGSGGQPCPAQMR
jgi:tetratricopeptide (TPR) repeat protein